MKERINRYAIALLSAIMVCLLAMPAALAYDHDQTYNADAVYFVPEDIVVQGYCNTTTVEVWMNTSVAIIVGEMEFDYIFCCANVTNFEHNTTNLAPSSPYSWEAGHVFIDFESDGVGPGPVHIGNLTIHCCNESSDCVTDLTWDDAVSYLLTEEEEEIVPNFGDATFTCEPVPIEFGDAPDPTYPSLLASDGARHTPTDTECLGLAISGTDWKDFEPDANVPDADLFDDGLPALALTTNNPAQTVDFEVTNKIAQNDLIVNILLDLNQNGVWDPGEHVVQNQPIDIVGPADRVFTSTAFSTVGATPGMTWMRITLTRQSINTGWNGTMASAGYAAEPFGCGETEDWEVMLEEKIIPAVETATGTGNATFESDAGTIVDLTAVAEGELPGEGKPVGMSFLHGFFSFNITGLDNGQTVNVTITLPDAVPVGTQYWKCIGSAWVQIPIGSDDGDNVITIQLTDGGLGDADGLVDGTIVDPGGSGTPPPAPEVPAMTPLGFVMVMFSLFGLVVFATRKVNKR